MTHQSPLDRYQKTIEGWAASGYSYGEVVEALARVGVPTTRHSLRRAFKRWGIGQQQTIKGVPTSGASTKIDGDNAELSGRPTLAYNSPDDLLKERGLSPDDWAITGFTVNEWDSPTGDILKQLKAHAKRRKPQEIIFPAQVDIDLPPPRGNISTDGSQFIVIASDQHAPFLDKNLHRLFCEWLRYNQPDKGIVAGDAGDLNTISRHPYEPEWKADVQSTVTGVGQFLYDYRLASLDTKWEMIPGNHDERLRRAVIDKLSEFYGVTPAQVPSLPDLPPIHHPRLLYRLDELGVDYAEPRGSYEQAQVNLSTKIAVRHGWIARKGSGASALGTLDQLGFSIVFGHTHRQAIVHQTKPDILGNPVQRTAVETGLMAEIKGGLGYAPAQDWQNGFATVTVWPDGSFHPELASYRDGALFYRNQRYT